jgi:hypothetical protein
VLSSSESLAVGRRVKLELGKLPKGITQILHTEVEEARVASAAADACAMMHSAIAEPDPVVFLESRAFCLVKAVFYLDAPVESVDGAGLRRSGSDGLFVTWGRMTSLALESAGSLCMRGIEAVVLGPRWPAPLGAVAHRPRVRSLRGAPRHRE